MRPEDSGRWSGFAVGSEVEVDEVDGKADHERAGDEQVKEWRAAAWPNYCV